MWELAMPWWEFVLRAVVVYVVLLTLVQLGAFGDAAKANAAWAAMNKRFGFLSGLKYKVAEGAGEGGRKVYRLQAAAGDAAAGQQLCAKLKAAGENCLVVK